MDVDWVLMAEISVGRIALDITHLQNFVLDSAMQLSWRKNEQNLIIMAILAAESAFQNVFRTETRWIINLELKTRKR